MRSSLPSLSPILRVAVLAALGISLGLSGPAKALAQNVSVVRDAEIEALVRDYARPIFKAAGLARSGVEIILVNDPSFNAFVAGRRMFINTGALLTSETPNEIIGVIAHEAGHIAGGHQERLRDQLARAQTMMILSTLLGLGAAVAGVATDTKGLGQVGTGLAMGGPELARRGLLDYQRTEEATADRSAVSYLADTGQSAKGMLTTFRRFQSALSLSGARLDPYQLSHPMPRERIANLEELARRSPYFDKLDPEALQLRHDMMRAKIAAYTQGQAAVRRLFRDNSRGLAAQYGDAQSTFLHGDPKAALKKVDALLKLRPKNPYFHELRGDILLRAAKPAAAAESYQRAVALDPAKSGILPIAHGQALLATGKPEALKQAIAEIKVGLARDKENFNGYAYLAQAYGQLGEVAEAELATAEGNFYSGSYQQAKIFAARAQQKLKRGTPSWVRAQDIINYKARPPKKK